MNESIDLAVPIYAKLQPASSLSLKGCVRAEDRFMKLVEERRVLNKINANMLVSAVLHMNILGEGPCSSLNRCRQL